MAQKNTKSIPLDIKTHELARKSAEEYGITMLEFFERAVERFHKKTFFDKLHADFQKLERLNKAWKEEVKRREITGINLQNGEEL